MALPDVKFTIVQGGLNREAAPADSRSGVLFISDFALELAPRLFTSIKEVEAAGITYDATATTDSAKSLNKAWQIANSFFALNPSAQLFWHSVTPTGAVVDTANIEALVNYSVGEIRQLGVYAETDHKSASASLDAIQAKLVTMTAEHKPLVVVAQLLPTSFTNATMSDCPDYRALLDAEIACVSGYAASSVTPVEDLISVTNSSYTINTVTDFINILGVDVTSQLPVGAFITITDGVNDGTYEITNSSFTGGNTVIKTTTDLSAAGAGTLSWTYEDVTSLAWSADVIPFLGIALGCVAKANVHENIGWVSKFNFGALLGDRTLFMDNGQPWSSFTTSALDTLNDRGLVFPRRHIGISGVYWNDSHTCVSASNDYGYLEQSRTVHKARRLIRTNMLPALSGPVYVDSNGRLTSATTNYFKTQAENPLEAMLRNREISAFEVVIDPTQNIISTGKLLVQVRIVPVATGRAIEIELGLTLTVTA